ncbi:MAG: hypothetical protein JW991_05515 [Candidatus Pacebacteria bacterium]|nr:hypothetical protein [Candidatus Paceibacterota bacterium]
MAGKTEKLTGVRDFFLKILHFKDGFLIDLAISLFLTGLNLFYLVPLAKNVGGGNNFSAPVIPLLARFLQLVFGLVKNRAEVISLIFFLCLGPAFLYFFGVKLCQRRLSAFASALIYSLPLEWLARGRIKMAFLVADGGHVAALSLVPLVVIFLLNFLRSGHFKHLFISSLSLALVALISPFGLLTGMMILLVVVFSELLQGEGRLKSLRLIIFLIASAGLMAFWYNPGFFLLFLRGPQGKAVIGTLWNLIPLSFVVLPILGAFGFLLFEKKAHLQPLFIALGLVILFSLVSLADYVGRFFPSHPRRYFPELGLSIAFLGGVLMTAFSDYLRFRGKFYKVKLTPLGRSLARKSFWLSALGLMGVLTVFSFRSIWLLPEDRILGVLDEGLTGQIWVIKNQAGQASTVIGYLLSGITVFLLGFTWSKIKKTAKSDKL